MFCTTRMGKRIEAAWTGGTASATIGVAKVPMPAKPPFDRPRMITAGMAAA
jgi:hypothetical protein